MCGIIGSINKRRKAKEIVLKGLSNLEYRGYDSAGIALVNNKKIEIIKSKGRLENLVKKINPNLKSSLAIGHTRWATHGEANEINAHPHQVGKITIVHNGIIENYLELKELLEGYGYTFKSTTDTEVACAFLDYYYNKTSNMKKAILKFMEKIKGSYAILAICSDTVDTIYTLKKDSPLIIGINKDDKYIASDIPAIISYTNNFYLLEDMEFAIITLKSINFYDKKGLSLKKEINTSLISKSFNSKGNYQHYMLKEIMEQSNTISLTVIPYLDNLDSLVDLKKYKQLDIVACGTAYHAGLIGKYLFEEFADIKTDVILASEYRYKKLFLDKSTLVIFISQSGETADTLAALSKVKEQNVDTLGIVNVKDSSIARSVDKVLYTEAGCEVAVASTKAYTAQVALISLLALKASYSKKLITEEMKNNVLNEFKFLAKDISTLLKQKQTYKNIALKLSKAHDIFYLGRSLDYYIMLEGSLKLKEITYLHSEAYPSGELKHGTISLIDKKSLVLISITDKYLKDKSLSNAIEVESRGAKTVYLTNQKLDKENTIQIDEKSPFTTTLLAIIPLQMIAYYTGVSLKRDIDKPRNLAKSVTVE